MIESIEQRMIKLCNLTKRLRGMSKEQMNNLAPLTNSGNTLWLRIQT